MMSFRPRRRVVGRRRRNERDRTSHGRLDREQPFDLSWLGAVVVESFSVERVGGIRGSGCYSHPPTKEREGGVIVIGDGDLARKGKEGEVSFGFRFTCEGRVPTDELL